MTARAKLIGILVAGLCLCGCATTPPQPPQPKEEALPVYHPTKHVTYPTP